MPMSRYRVAATIVAGIVAVLSARVSAQWFNYPTPNVPRLANGKVNLQAPAPRTADGKPDFSGIWLADNHLPCPPLLRDGDDCLEKTPLSAWAYHIDADLKEGLPYQPWAAEVAKARQAANSADDPHAKCLPSNPPRMFTLPHYLRVLQMPGLLTLLSEYNASYRLIYIDGRPLPEDPQPSWNGYSTAKWEGDALVVQTNGLRDELWLDVAGNPMTDAAALTERIRRPDFGTLEIELTVNDPKAYTRPWTVQVRQKIVVDSDLIDEFCLEGMKPLHVAK
jgi:hypothetical protein